MHTRSSPRGTRWHPARGSSLEGQDGAVERCAAGLDASADATSSSKIAIFISLPVVFLVLAAAAAAAFFVFKKKKTKKKKKPPARLERPAGLTKDQGSSFMSAEL